MLHSRSIFARSFVAATALCLAFAGCDDTPPEEIDELAYLNSLSDPSPEQIRRRVDLHVRYESGRSSHESRPKAYVSGTGQPKSAKDSFDLAMSNVGGDWRDLLLMPAASYVGAIPTVGRNLVLVASVDHQLHFRIFDFDGKMIVDTDESRLMDKSRQIEVLREKLETLWPPHELTGGERDWVNNTVTSIAGLPGGDRVVAEKAFREVMDRSHKNEEFKKAIRALWMLEHRRQLSR